MGCCASNDAIGAMNHGGANMMYPNTPNSSGLSPTKLSKSGGKNFTPFDHPLYQGDLGEASRLFFLEEYAEAAEIYKQYI